MKEQPKHSNQILIKEYSLVNKNMALQNFAIDLPSDILLTLNLSEKELKQRIKYALAIQLYTQLKVTIGKAAQIAELSRFEFETMLAENNVPISTLELEDVLLDVEKLK